MMTARAAGTALGPEVKMTVIDPDELEALVSAASGEAATIADLQAAVARLHQVQQARLALSRLDAATLRAVLEARRESLGGQHP